MNPHAATAEPQKGKADFATLKRFLPYLWPKHEPRLRARVVAAMVLVLVAKSTTLIMPFAFKGAIDQMAAGVPDGVAIAVALVAGLCAGAALAGCCSTICATPSSRRVGQTAASRLQPGRVRAHPPAQPALPPRTPHRLADPHRRARHQEHRHDALFHPVQHLPDDLRTDRGLRHFLDRSPAPAWSPRCWSWSSPTSPIRRRSPTGAPSCAARWSTATTRRWPAPSTSLLNYETVKYFNAESAREPQLCAGRAALHQGRHQERSLAGLAQHRPVADHQHHDGRRHGLYRLGLEPGQVHRRRRGAGQYPAGAAVPAARHARHGLSRDQAGPHRHGIDVRPDRYAGRDRRHSGRQAARCQRRPCALFRCRFRL